MRNKISRSDVSASLHENSNILKSRNEIDEGNPNLSLDQADIDNQLKKSVNSLVISLTEKCNLRCDYCVFDALNNYRRNHSKKCISEKVLQKALRTVKRRSGNEKEVNIIFTGGEPLLDFQLLQYAVNKSYSVLESDDINFTLITNGTNFNKYVHFLIEHDFSINVSLDGPKELHDAHRKTKNNNGSFNKLIENLEYFHAHDSEFYEKKVSFNATLTPPYRYTDVDDFFRTNPLTKNQSVNANYLEIHGKPEKELHSSTKFNSQFLKLKKRFIDYITQLDKGEIKTKIGRSVFVRHLRRIHQRDMKMINEGFWPHTMCVPGPYKLFVDTEGNFYPCQKSDNNSIGTVENGINERKSKNLLDKYVKLNKTYCQDCWAVRLCNACLPKLWSGGDFNKPRNKWKCEEIRNLLTHSLEMFCEIGEKTQGDFSCLYE